MGGCLDMSREAKMRRVTCGVSWGDLWCLVGVTCGVPDRALQVTQHITETYISGLTSGTYAIGVSVLRTEGTNTCEQQSAGRRTADQRLSIPESGRGGCS
jgi:hypothetical protein